MTDVAEHGLRSPHPSSSADGPPFESRLVERALSTAGALSPDRIHQWGQYHGSRLAHHVLARLAYPSDPEAVLDIRRNRARLRKAALNLEAVCALAAGIGLKARTRAERDTALDLFDLAHERLGNRLPAPYRELHATTAYLNGLGSRAKALAKAYDGLPAYLGEAFRCQDAHPRNGGSAQAFKRRFAEFAGLPGPCAPDDSAPSIDSLRTEPVPNVDKGPLITVVMSCYRPGRELLTAVRSIVAQSWQNWQLLLVDDASGPEYAPVLNEAAAVDPRVELLVQPENGGTYQARNRAMSVAAGAFVTGLDSDDWAHPLRLEKQVQPLLKDRDLAMVESSCLAVREDLSLVIDPQVALIAARSTPIMVRAEAMRHVGFYDEVRKSADSEYRYRIKAALGRKAAVRAASGPLTLVRHAETTLSAGEVSRHWMSASRLAYHCGFTYWHRKIAKGEASPHLPALARPRPFPIGRDITRADPRHKAIAYQRIYAADWRSVDRQRRSMLEDAAAEAGKGHAVGLVHCPDWVEVDGKRPLINRSVLQAAAEHGLDFVDLDQRHTAPVIVPTEPYAELVRFEHPGLPASRVRVQPAVQGPPAEPRAFAEAPPRRPAPRRALSRRYAQVAGLGLCSAAAAIAAAGLGAGAQLTASATMGALGLSSAAVALGLRRALHAARAEAASQSAPPGRASRRGLPKQRARELEMWRSRLDNGWSATASEALLRAADSEREHPEFRVRALAALCDHHAARGGRHRTTRTLEADIVIVSTMNLRGGTTAANVAEILAYRAAGLRIGLVHHPVLDRAMDRPIDARIRALIDEEQVFEVGARDTVRCDLAIVRFPAAPANLMDDRPRIDAARTVLLVNQTPFEQYGPTGGYGTAWSIGDVHRNITAWLGPHTWYAIGPAVRDALRVHHADELADVEQAEDFWYETIDVAQWTPPSPRVRAAGEPIRIGRHSRDHVTKFPNMAKRLHAAYPSAEDLEVHVLGGHEALRRILGAIPEGWTSHPFGTMSPAEFLGGVDVYVYFVDENLVEAFGRAPLEAMAAGVPCVLPRQFAELFGDGAVYCEPDEVETHVRRLMADPDHYAERARAGLRVVHERFSPEALVRRVSGLGVAVAPSATATSTGGTR